MTLPMDDLVKRLLARADEQERSNSYPVDRAMDREAAAEITRLRAEVKAAEVRSQTVKDAMDLLSQDVCFVSGGRDYGSSKLDLCVDYSRYVADAEEVPDEYVSTLAEAGRKFGFRDAGMGWVLARRNEDKLVKGETTANILAARDWLAAAIRALAEEKG